MTPDSPAAVWARAHERLETLGGAGRLREPVGAYRLQQHQGWIEAVSGEHDPIAAGVRVSGAENVLAAGFLSATPSGVSVRIAGDRNLIFFGPKSRLSGVEFDIEGNGNLIYFGALTSAGRTVVRLRGDGRSVVVGDRCMLSFGIFFGEMNGVDLYEIESGRRLWAQGDIHVGDHVWIGRNVALKPGTSVAGDTVVGQSAGLSGAYPPNVILAGDPARVIRSEVTWGRSTEPTLAEQRASKHYLGHTLRQIKLIEARIAEFAPEPDVV